MHTLIIYEWCHWCEPNQNTKSYIYSLTIQLNRTTGFKKKKRKRTRKKEENSALKFLSFSVSTTSIRIVYTSIQLIYYFPHTWQVKPHRNDKNYKIKIINGQKRGIFIFKELIEFVQRTKRFNREKFAI